MNRTRQLQKKIWLTTLVVLLFIAVVMALFIYRLYTPTVLSSDSLRDSGFFLFDNPRTFDALEGNNELVDHNNEPFTMDNLRGQWSMIFFGFTYCPDICPTTMALLNQLYQAQQATPFGKDLQVIMVSVDPARDEPELLKSYVEYFNPEFIGVTGDFIATHRLATQLSIPFGKVPGMGDDYLVDHSGNIALIDPQGHYVGFFKSPLDIEQFERTYRSIRLMNE